MIRLRPSGVDEVLIKRVQDWYEPGPGVFIASTAGQAASFTPASLFTGSTTGVWYDPSDYTTLFQDAAGTTPVTAVEQPVGLMLDKRNTAYSVTNGGFTVPSSSAFAFGTGDFTIEVWFYASSTGRETEFITFRPVGGNGAYPLLYTWDNNAIRYFVNGADVITGTLPLNTWVHIALARSGTSTKLFLNGTQAGSTYADTNNYLVGSDAPRFSTSLGYFSNLRIVKGTALYTANFTPPTAPLTPVAGTSLLTCGTSWSGNPAITLTGSLRVDKLNPFTTGTGNHAFQSNSANRPTLSARYNLLTKTEQFDDAYWNAQTVETTVSANTSETTDPLGGNTADKLIATTANAFHQRGSSALSTTAGVPVTLSISSKVGGYDYVQLGLTASNTYAKYASVVVKLSDGTNAGTGGQVGGWTLGTPSITSQGNGWYRIQVTVTPDSSVSTAYVFLNVSNSATIAAFAGNGTSGIYIWGADLRVANDALNQPAYQRVNTSTDYDTVGFKPYLLFNGTSSAMQTNSIDFTATDKMFVGAGVRKLADGNYGVVAEISTSYELNSGVFSAGGGFNPDLVFASKGTISALASYNAAAPTTKVLSGVGNIFGDRAILRLNGTQVAEITTDQGTGNYGNYPLYIGARAGSSFWFNGRLYQMVVAGKQATAAEITSTETYLNNKTGAF